MTDAPYKKKLIEVAIPLEAINAASAKEKSIRFGHPSTLHLWWARRPLAACRAVLFAQLVDDPSGHLEELLKDSKNRSAAETELKKRMGVWNKRREELESSVANTQKPTLEDCVADIERKRLFQIIEDLVKWENSANEEVLERARTEIRKSWDGKLPPIYDPFSGGGSIPLEAQRLGLPAYGSDLNPVAVIIGKAMIEIPPKFKDQPPVYPGVHERNHYRNAEGLAEDVKYYGTWMREKAWERIGHLYPQADLPQEHGGGKATVIAWIWARTVPSPDPAFSDVHVPVASSFLLSSKPGKEAWIEPIVDRLAKTITFRIRYGGTKLEIATAKAGTKAGRGANFNCLISGSAITSDYVKRKGQEGAIGSSLIAIAVKFNRKRIYLPPNKKHESVALQTNSDWSPEISLPNHSQYVGVLGYGFKDFSDLFTQRQLVAISTYTDLIKEVIERIKLDAEKAGLKSDELPLAEGGNGARSYAEAVGVYLALGVSRLADIQNALCMWESSKTQVRHLFTRHAIPMLWDYAECGLFSESAGDFSVSLGSIVRVIERLGAGSDGSLRQSDAQSVEYPPGSVISSDPPYYDNVPYADISDFFYSWLRRSLGDLYPRLFATLSVPKAEELVADRMRHGGAEKADEFFLQGMSAAVSQMFSGSGDLAPATIYYAFKQSEIEQEGVSSSGWIAFLEAILDSGYSVVATWPVRTELANRIRGIGSNALANSIVLVCRKKETRAETATRAEFIRALKRELPQAIAELQAANVSPADMPQSAIGPGIGVFSRYKAVLEADDSPMIVKAALQLVNAELDEYLGGIQGEFDADTRFAITWFEQNGMKAGEYGTANNIATARGISVESVKHAGIVESSAGKVRILKRNELDDDWEPQTDTHLTIWECLQYLVRQHEEHGISYDTAVLLKKIGDKADAVKDLSYCLYDISANKRKDAKEATAYNALITDWTELTREAATIHDTRGDGQTNLDL